MEASKPTLKRSFRIVCVSSPKKKDKRFIQDSNWIIVSQRLSLEEGRLKPGQSVIPRRRHWFQRKVTLSLSQVLDALVQARICRRIGLLNRIYNAKTMMCSQLWTNRAIDEYIESDRMIVQLSQQIRWLNQLEQMPTVMELESFDYYVNQMERHSQELNFSKVPSYLSSGIEEFFRNDIHFQKQSAHQELCRLIISSHSLMDGNNQLSRQIEEIKEKLCCYLCKKHDIKEANRTAADKMVAYYVDARVGMFLSK